MRISQRVPYDAFKAGVTSGVSLEIMSKSAAFRELLDVPDVDRQPLEFALGRYAQPEVARPVPAPLPTVTPTPMRMDVDRPSAVQEEVARARAARLGNPAPSLSDWAAAGFGG